METVITAMDVDKLTFEQEQTNLVKTILNERFFKPWMQCQEDSGSAYALWNDSALELYLTSSCNQKCEYCYLQKYPQLYPSEFNNKTLILKNLGIFLDWIEGKQFVIPKVELYSGEIWHNEYGLEVLEIVYNSLKSWRWTNSIIIPSNCSFVLNESQLNKIQRYINKFAKIDVRLCFSISVDGAIVENETRPLNSNEARTEEFYDRLFLFAQHNGYFFHPMVAASSIHKWIENFEWWKTMCNKYDMDVDRAVMMLEVRNDNWTEECIQKYCELLDHMIEDEKIRKCNNDNNIFFRRIFCLGQNEPDPIDGYIPYGVSPADTFAGCSVANYLTVRLGDMAICPCHRTAYNRLLYGWFKVEDNQIVDIIGNNPQMATRVLMSNNTYCTLGCDVCKYHTICLKGCFGSQYEALGDPFYPIQNICDFFIAKYSFLINKYIEMGAIDYLNSYTPYYLFYPRVCELKKIFKECQ